MSCSEMAGVRLSHSRAGTVTTVLREPGESLQLSSAMGPLRSTAAIEVTWRSALTHPREYQLSSM
jgi:hypothetical protein